jgi:hypothetical protein
MLLRHFAEHDRRRNPDGSFLTRRWRKPDLNFSSLSGSVPPRAGGVVPGNHVARPRRVSPSRDQWFESISLQRRVSNKPFRRWASMEPLSRTLQVRLYRSGLVRRRGSRQGRPVVSRSHAAARPDGDWMAAPDRGARRQRSHSATQIDAAFATAVQRQIGAVVVSDPLFDSLAKQVAAAAARHARVKLGDEANPLGLLITG